MMATTTSSSTRVKPSRRKRRACRTGEHDIEDPSQTNKRNELRWEGGPTAPPGVGTRATPGRIGRAAKKQHNGSVSQCNKIPASVASGGRQSPGTHGLPGGSRLPLAVSSLKM